MDISWTPPSLLPFPSFPFLFHSPSFPPCPLTSFPLEVGPLKLRGLESAVSYPSGVWSAAPVQIKFCAFSLKIWHLIAPILLVLNMWALGCSVVSLMASLHCIYQSQTPTLYSFNYKFNRLLSFQFIKTY